MKGGEKKAWRGGDGMKSTKAVGTQDERGKDIPRRTRNYSSMLTDTDFFYANWKL